MVALTTNVLLLLLPAAISVNYAYDEGLARKLVLMSDVAYCGDDQHGGTGGIKKWDCPPCRALGDLAVSDVAVFQNIHEQTFGFTAMLNATLPHAIPSILVSLRGSVLRQNYLDDLDQVLKPLPNTTQGQVHRGSYRAYITLRDEMLQQVTSLRKKYPGVSSILVTGHSMGAALSVYASSDLALAHRDLQVILYAFGTPRPGDSAFNSFLRSQSNLHIWNVINGKDIVPQCGLYRPPFCNQQWNGFQQIDRVVWYKSTTSPIVHCLAEDPGCQNSVSWWSLNMEDHDTYLNHSMWCCDAAGVGPHGEGCNFPFSSSQAGLILS